MNMTLPKMDVITFIFTLVKFYIIDLGASVFYLLCFKNYLEFNKHDSFHDSVELIQNLENRSTFNSIMSSIFHFSQS